MYGNRIMSLTFDNNTTFRWIFIIAHVPHNILGIDFLHQNALVVDFANSFLNNSLSNISWILVKQVCSIEIPKPFLVTNDYLKMLQSFPKLTKPPNSDKPVKHDVVHEIETNGYPCHACAYPLTSEKLQIVQKEIDFMLKAGYITRSSSEYLSPIHLVPKKRNW